ncbi:hypothetical protein TSAR_004993 [Trichomalopsis sarcophagae]|uniref:Uncharacterized protein n=1 Tax=Trichomalopsis sarcophagae TaxID=543379 RepID=A0A232EKF5_9HYME|nr:hypothetical protein TSAR_004993 [Trichomalopsis sarcophagae]
MERYRRARFKARNEKERRQKYKEARLPAANMHLKENKITYFFLFGARDRPLCSADKMKKTLFCVFLNHPIVTNNSANMHLKENKITYFFPFGPRDRLLCSTDTMKKELKSMAVAVIDESGDCALKTHILSLSVNDHIGGTSQKENWSYALFAALHKDNNKLVN